MYKLALKLTLAIIAVVGLASLLPTAHVAADSPLCPSNSRVGNQIPANYGYNKGELADGFAGLVVASSVGTMTNGQPDDKGRTGNPIDAKYYMRSVVPDAPSGYEYRLGGRSQSNRIFTVDAGNNPIDRTDQRWFGTNGSTGDNLYAGGGGFTCPGWDALGPGNSTEIGNRHALDCGESYYLPGNPTKQGTISTRFWIDSLASPNGESGQWEAVLYNPDGSVKYDINNFGPGSMGPSDFQRYFTVKNGATIRVNLIWHADPPSGGPDVDSECTHLHVQDGGTWTRPSDGKVFSSGDVRTKVRVEDSGGHALVHPANDYPSQYFYLNNESQDWWYTPLGRNVYVTVVREYRSSSGVWNFAQDDSRNHYNCYNTNCSISAASNVAGKPQGVKAGSLVAVTVRVNNLGVIGLPNQLNGHEFWFDSDGGQTGGLQSVNIRLPNIGRGGFFQTTILITAPGSAGHYHFSGSPVYRGLMYPEDANCGYDIDVYQPFGVSLSASSSLSPTDENPNTATYSTTVNPSPPSPAVYIPTNSTFYKKFAIGGQLTLATGSGGIYPGTQWSGTYSIPPGSFVAGDQYCATVHAQYLSGWIGPNGPYDVAETGPGGDSTPSCPKVTNEPYFKVFNSAISARNGITDAAGACSATAANSGLLAGWNDNLDGPGADRGSGSQLSALALIKITGVASAQTDINRSPTDLTFANTVPSDISTARESPSLGGNIGGTPTCNSPPVQEPGAANLGGNPANLPASGNYQRTGSVRLNGGTISGATAIFVKGDVYLNGNITYSPLGWAPGSVPSFVLVATGNIYIDPSVTQLDGTFVSQPTNASAGGTIYTCAAITSPTIFRVNSDFTACHNQLLVNGSFTANKVKLLRTFGSLRDETPTPGSPGGAAVDLTWSSCGAPGKGIAGESCPPSFSGLRCVDTNEPSDPDGWWDNKLCVPNTSTLHLAWTHFDNSPFNDPNKDPGKSDPGMLNADYWKSLGYKYCTKWDVPPDYAQTWYDNTLCMDQARADGSALIHFVATPTPGEKCTTVNELADREGQWPSGYYLCVPSAPAVPPSAPGAPVCSNAGLRPPAAASPYIIGTCAAEVFEFSPEFYLSVPAVQPPNMGATQYDAITSLPPVL